ncbi:MAG: hypothetical protein PF481_07160 [Bacteroidales bacterium]|jgi:hypothetical protein|nr:hypothetical protein [Bacteroidales bacterium]
MLRFFSTLSLIIFSLPVFSEGTKELRPTTSDWGNVEINDQGRSFALESNTDPLHRLYINIADVSETIYFGFQPNDKTAGTGTFRIKDPSGNIVYPASGDRENVPVSSGNGYIETYDEACAGPKISGAPADGYTPLSYTPTTTGDFYIEFTTSLSGTYHFDLFDITVVDNSNDPILGRLWSYAWDLSTRGSNNEMYTTFFIYTTDQYVSSVDMNGIQPWGFVISANSTGTANTGTLFEDRQSVEGNSTYPEFKVFLNMPDTTVYEIAEKPTMVEDLKVLGEPERFEEVLFYLNMDKGGTVEIFLDLDGTTGYQADGEDIVLVQNIEPGGDTVIWDGKDGNGDYVEGEVIVGISSRFSTGVTHLPLYDPEYHPNGYIVHSILPDSARVNLYWDDSQIGGTTEFEGVMADTNGHNFPDEIDGFGNERTINTWWNGYEDNNLKSFSFSLLGAPLPIELTRWDIQYLGNYVQLSWTTATETNNNKFIIERSQDGINWEKYVSVPGAGNSSSYVHYHEIDENPYTGISYYRLKQIDYDGTFTFSKVKSIQTNFEHGQNIRVFCYVKNNIVTITGNNLSISDIYIRTTTGKDISPLTPITQIDSLTFEIDFSNVAAGSYIIQTPYSQKIISKK